MLNLRLIRNGDVTEATLDQRPFPGGRLTIGRGPANNWVLADPTRVISKQHCEIIEQGGAFHVIDNSSNGVMLNGARDRLPFGETVPLRLGDRLQIGDYVLILEAGAAPAALPARSAAPKSAAPKSAAPKSAPPRDLAIPAFDDFEPAPAAPGGFAGDDFPEFNPQRPAAPPFSSASASPGGVIGDDFDWDRPASEAPQQDFAPLPDNWEEDVTPRQHFDSSGRSDAFVKPMLADVKHGRDAFEIPTQWGEVDPGASLLVSAMVGAPPASAAPQADFGDAFRAFLEGAQLDAKDFADCTPEQVMRSAGAAYRQTILGLADILKDRAVAKNEMRIARTTLQVAENNPMKFLPPQNAAVLLLNPGKSGFLGAEEAVTLACQDIKKHQLSLLAGMRAAVRTVFDRFRPERIEDRLKALTKVALLAGGGKDAQAWREYRAYYEKFHRDADDNPNSLVNSEFRRGYEEQIQALDHLDGQ